jgi:hypothetical protein
MRRGSQASLDDGCNTHRADKYRMLMRVQCDGGFVARVWTDDATRLLALGARTLGCRSRML